MKEPKLLTLSRVKIVDIVVRDRLRPVSGAAVESLIASITEIGVIKDPIHIAKKGGQLILIAGGHRLAAAKRLNWEEIEAKVWDRPSDDWMKLVEIDDNLAGAEMTPLDNAVFLAERKAIYERLHPETQRGVAGAVARWDATDMTSVASFAAATAQKFGLSDRQVRRLTRAGASLDTKQIDILRGAQPPITLKDLVDLSRVTDPEERAAIVELRAYDGPSTVAAAIREFQGGSAPPEPNKADQDYLDLVTAWKRASTAARRRFAEDFGSAVAAAGRAKAQDQGVDDGAE